MKLLTNFKKWFKDLICKIGWHHRPYEYLEFDGASQHARCKWCGYAGMIDSQGNLF